MPFEVSARALLRTLTPRAPNYEILHFLLTNALGRADAKSWDEIDVHCTAIGVPVDQRQFQQGFLAATRDGPEYIGSSSSGYFIIKDRDDAKEMARFYEVRIARETEHLDHLKVLVVAQGWPAI